MELTCEPWPTCDFEFWPDSSMKYENGRFCRHLATDFYTRMMGSTITFSPVRVAITKDVEYKARCSEHFRLTHDMKLITIKEYTNFKVTQEIMDE